ncbi:MAG: tol-pal system-associated acyl-CoA thioesterase [Acidiferrobacteraceae bacterium]|jgi:acyl-CoA thioester hydrolase|nr:tol-pal system-associated acyl-CoA thioesterase [Acidiferrobacteraceae bacterium]MDP6398986.1 tol-pal system-associated acyl-CoA thioesterase [Arenicellales bacterium]MDP6550909.1 tol-pal system-associated acyl-CoA thioesterase [Arenicellales bacterium]MDP6790715.1 tol-pal system-associated acyl-CoA thioesterase [Arenicellales bacterium]MDP6917943.1 tol-pal system-associated acyl-CoA thioesterase [Arenicellales bacterium]|tara:strand:+ start:36330 stop:36740 length:411 start_codon:yes stop_codon:yes gene_type:complete
MVSTQAFIWPVRVYYEDTDAGGIVYYANYLKFMERARTEWLRNYGIDLRKLTDDGQMMFVVRSARLDFLQPAHLGDTLEVSVEVLRRRPASVTLHQRVVGSGEVLCTGEVRLACIEPLSMRPRPLPPFIQEGENTQ